MSAITRKGDSCTGHGCFPPRTSTEGESTFPVNSKPAVCIGHGYEVHGCPNNPPHGGVQSSGSPNVFAKGKAVGRVGDSIDCGSSVASGSPNTFIN